MMTAASVQDRDGAQHLLESLRHQFFRLRLIWADQAYVAQTSETIIRVAMIHLMIRRLARNRTLLNLL
jgi:hypothetical protein